MTTLAPHVGVALNSPAHNSAAASSLNKNGARFSGFFWSGEAERPCELVEREKMNGFICPPFSNAEDLGFACNLVVAFHFFKVWRSTTLALLGEQR